MPVRPFDSRFRPHRVVSAALGLLAALLAVASPHSPEMLISGDGVAYVETAERLVHEGAFVGQVARWDDRDTVAALTHWPPGYSLALAVPLAAGAPRLAAARAVRAVSAFVTVALVVLLVSHAAGAGAGALAAVTVMLTPTIVYSHMIGLSEALFLALVALTVYLMVRHPARPLAYGLAAAIAVMVRYIGLSLTGAVAAWAFLQPGRLVERLRRALLAVAPSIVLQLAWVYAARDGSEPIRNFGVFGTVLGVARMWLGGMAIHLAPALDHPLWRVVAKLLVGAIFALVVVAGVVAVLRRPRPTAAVADPPTAARLFAACALVVAAYSAVYILSKLFADYALDFHRRYYGPVDLLVDVAVVTGLAIWWRERSRPVALAVGAVFAAWLAGSAVATAREVRVARHEEREWTEKFERSALLAWVRASAGDRPLFTNWAAPLYFHADRSARELPWVFNEDIPQFGDVLARSDGLLVFFREKTLQVMLPPELRDRYAEPTAMARFLGLREVASFPDGVVWEAPRRPGGEPVGPSASEAAAAGGAQSAAP